jgi:hypothetical protein
LCSTGLQSLTIRYERKLSSLQSKMERFCRRPFKSIDEYATARVQGYSNIAVGLHATVWQNRRTMDAFQFRVGGDIFNVEASLDSFIPLPEFKGWMVRFQQRPANILIRPNMATSVWQCLAALVMMREADIFDASWSDIAAGEFVRFLNDLEKEPDAASFRWAVVTTDTIGIGLQLQTLPSSASVLCGKPALRK